MTDYVADYFAAALHLLQVVARDAADSIHQAAGMVADAIQQDRECLLFGSGHSALIARDACGRAGGLVPMLALEDIADGDAERLEGVARVIAGRYTLRAGSVMIVISNSGINPVPIEMAQLAKKSGLNVIAVLSLKHSQSVASRHSSGAKLYEAADLAIDTQVMPGDAAVILPDSGLKTGAVSTMIGSAIVQAITAQAAGLLAERGLAPPILISANLPEGDAHNRALLAHYQARLVRYAFQMYTP